MSFAVVGRRRPVSTIVVVGESQNRTFGEVTESDIRGITESDIRGITESDIRRITHPSTSLDTFRALYDVL